MTSTKVLRQRARRLGISIGERFFHAAQCGLCPLCNKDIVLGNQTISYDHVWPLKETEDSVNLHQGNLLLVHEKCNREKGNSPPSAHELIILSMVNERLDFDEASGQYGRRQNYLNALLRRHKELTNEYALMVEKSNGVDWEHNFLYNITIDMLKGSIQILEKAIEHQREVFKNYRYLYDQSS